MRRWACEWLGAMTARGGYTLKGFVLITPGYHRVFDHWGQSELTIDRMIIQEGVERHKLWTTGRCGWASTL
jgi:hypothetical protein